LIKFVLYLENILLRSDGFIVSAWGLSKLICYIKFGCLLCLPEVSTIANRLAGNGSACADDMAFEIQKMNN
jgi:hypothetical protein